MLVLAPGATLATEAGRAAVADAGADVTVSANFVPDFAAPDYAFFTNAKRFDESAAYPCPLILTSNLRAAADATVVNYDRLSGTDAQGGNSVLMLLRLLRLCGAAEVLLAGADGYRPGTAAYADAGLHTHTARRGLQRTAGRGHPRRRAAGALYHPQRIRKGVMMIRLLVLDVDGTMTDGGVYYDATGNELKKFAIKDGAGLVLARAAGIRVMICTGRECEAVRRRAADLKITDIYQNVSRKADFLRDFMAQNSYAREEAAYCGDDLNDLAAMALCGFVACPADAAPEVKARADYIAPSAAAKVPSAAR